MIGKYVEKFAAVSEAIKALIPNGWMAWVSNRSISSIRANIFDAEKALSHVVRVSCAMHTSLECYFGADTAVFRSRAGVHET
jgi:hypothetical protein